MTDSIGSPTPSPSPSASDLLVSLVDAAMTELEAEFERHVDEWISQELEGGGTGHPVGLLTTATAIYRDPQPITTADLVATYKLIEDQPYTPDLTYFLPERARQARS